MTILYILKKFFGIKTKVKEEVKEEIIKEGEKVIDLMTAPRGVRNNNPGNIDFNPCNKWKGLNPKSKELDSRFCVFISAEYGLRALMILLRNYQNKYKLNTIRKIINRWAPSVENNTSAYMNHVAKVMNVGVDDELNLSKREVLISLAKGIVIHENGCQPYGDPIYQSAYELI